jgi:hypothetical protein
MKKFYSSIVIIAVVTLHISARFVMSDAITFSVSDYENLGVTTNTYTEVLPVENVASGTPGFYTPKFSPRLMIYNAPLDLTLTEQ